MNIRGMTLIELSVVIAIISILVVVTGFQFTGWLAKYKVESQIEEMHANIISARQRAMQRNITHFIRLATATPYEYATYEDTDGDNTLTPGPDTQIGGLSKQNLQYRITWNGGDNPLDISMNRRGLTSPLRSIWLLKRDGTTYSDDEVDYDCIVISRTRINKGKYDDSASTPCVGK